MHAKIVTIPPRIFWLASLLFFISGGTGLAYQVVWFKRFSHVWGSTSLAFAAVGGSFLFGLGLGAYLLGRYADRARQPLRWYGVCELAIGALALVIPFEIAALVNASAGLYSGIPEQPVLRYLVQFGITLLVVGPPCVLMGGTLPLLIRQLTTREGSLDQATGWLYAINTFGAAAGCYLAGFHLIASLGLLWTNNLAATINIAIGLVSIAVARSAEPRQKARPAAVPAMPTKLKWTRALAGLYVATVLSGCGALVLEMTWTRQLALVLGGSTYAFTATLFVVLIGIALGSLLFHLVLRRVASNPVVPLAVVGVLIVSTLVGKLALPELSQWVGSKDVQTMRGDQVGNALVCVGASAALEFVPSLAMGILFPLFVHMTQASAAAVGAAVGNIYAWNTLGSIVGASFTALLLFPWIGTAGAVALAGGLYVVAALAVVPWRGGVNFSMAGVAAVAGGLAIYVLALPINPRETNMGLYIYGVPDPPELLLNHPVHFFREGASSNVLVSSGPRGDNHLRVNGKIDASGAQDMVTQLGSAYLPRVFKHDARDVLVIGFGSGTTPGKCLSFPDTLVTCCEIEPAVYEAAEYFGDYNGRPYEKTRAWLETHNDSLPVDERASAEQIAKEARFSMVFGDGRTVIQGSDKKYDLIISEPSNPWLAGVSNLFTTEFFRFAREHLVDDGVLAQWIQTYNFTPADYLMIVRTLLTEFPHCGVLVLIGGADTVLLASREPLLPTSEKIAALQKLVDANPEIVSDLKTWFGGSDLRYLLMQHYELGEDQLKQLVEADRSQALNTDLHLQLEFDAPLHLFRKMSPRDTATYMLYTAMSPRWTSRLGGQMGLDANSAEFHVTAGQYLLNQMGNEALRQGMEQQGALNKAAAHFEAAMKADAKSTDALLGLARTRARQNRVQDARQSFEELVRRLPDSAEGHGELAGQLLALQDSAPAIEHYREALRLQPKVSLDNGGLLWANNLAWLLATNSQESLRNGKEAVAWARLACEADTRKSPEYLDTLATALAEDGQFDEAIRVTEQLISSAANNPALIATARDRLKLYRESKPYHEPAPNRAVTPGS